MLLKHSNILSESELNVYINELNSPRLCWLDEKDFHNTIVKYIQLISILTGADVYEAGSWKNDMLVSSIKNLFAMSSVNMNLTVNEVMSAFYLNHNSVFDKVHTMYGKPISADYIGNVLANYREYKLRPLEKQWAIDRLLSPPPPKEVPKYTPEDYKTFIQQDYENWKAGHTDYIFLIYEKYLLMRKWNFIIYPSLEIWKAWYKRALARRETSLMAQIPINKAEKLARKKKLEIYKHIRNTNIVPPEENKSVVHMMRKLVYFRMFELMHVAGIKNIFSEISRTKYNEQDKKMYFEFKSGT